jgi:hypothetical protein
VVVVRPCQHAPDHGRDLHAEAARVRLRVHVSVRLDPTCDRRVEVHFSTEHLTSETARTQLEEGDVFAIVGTVGQPEAAPALVEPLVMGSACPEAEDATALPSLESYVDEWARIPMEAIDQFAKAAEQPLPPDSEAMRDVSERAFKTCLAELLGDTPPSDWGGETSDYFSAHMSISGRPYTGAFLLKGPARFAPMETSHLDDEDLGWFLHQPQQLILVLPQGEGGWGPNATPNARQPRAVAARCGRGGLVGVAGLPLRGPRGRSCSVRAARCVTGVATVPIMGAACLAPTLGAGYNGKGTGCGSSLAVP